MKTVITNANVFDGYNEKLTAGASIIIEDNMVVDIAQGDIAAGSFDRVIDAEGRTVMPGLADAHVHLFFTAPTPVMDTMRLDEMAVRSTCFAKEMLLRGFTTVRDACGVTFGLKKNIDSGFLDGPRIFPSNACISQTCGHGDFRTNHAEERLANGEHTSPYLRSKGHILADGVPEVLRAVRDQFFLGASQIKMQAGGGNASMCDPVPTVQYSFEEMKAIVGAAKDYGTYVMAHIYTPPALQRAAEAGVMCFEHATLMDDETARIIQDKGIWLCPCPQFGRPVTPERRKQMPELFWQKRQVMIEGEISEAELINKHNLRIVYGTDSAGDPERIATTQLDDLRYYKKHFGSLQGIRAATGNFNELIKLCTYQNPYPDGKIGLLEAGSYADLLIIDGNPVDDLDILADPANMRLIMKDGNIYKNTL